MYKILLTLASTAIMCHAGFLENSLNSLAGDIKNQVNTVLPQTSSETQAEPKNEKVLIETDLDKAIESSETINQKIDAFSIKLHDTKNKCSEIRYLEMNGDNAKIYYDTNALKTFYTDAPAVNAKIRAYNQKYIETNKDEASFIVEQALRNHEKGQKNGRHCSQIRNALLRYNDKIHGFAEYVSTKNVNRKNILNIQCNSWESRDDVMIINDPCPEVANLEEYVEEIKQAYREMITEQKEKALEEERQILKIKQGSAEIEQLEREEKKARLEQEQAEQRKREEAQKQNQLRNNLKTKL